ncbi:MAG: S41 family peptidase, partial [Candidatus Theseobacter exili]|nr:S41 family peptidase [Candidatus Theseobacter exili]
KEGLLMLFCRKNPFLNKIFVLSLLCFCLGSLTGFTQEEKGIKEKEPAVQKERKGPLDPEKIYEQLELFANAIAIVDQNYVEDVDTKTLIYGAMKGMLNSLDPHSQFMNPEAYKEMQEDTEGKFGGIGIEITIKDNILTVITPIVGTPAFIAGIKAGDKIVKINKKSTKNMTLMQAVKWMRGKPGSKVNLRILRGQEKAFLDFTIERDIIKIESIKEKKIIKDGIGYIRVTDFQERSGTDLFKAIKSLTKDGMKSVILDLRNNPGGLLQAAVDVSDKFIKKGNVIVSTKGRKSDQNMTFRAREEEMERCPLVVLINEGSASAAEIVAGAVQDWNRGLLVGVKSFGKGSVQSVLPLKDGSALRLTTAKYFTPNGRSIQGTGIEPDITVRLPEQAQKEEDIKKKNGEDEEKDVQLEKAVSILQNTDLYQDLMNKKKDKEKDTKQEK